MVLIFPTSSGPDDREYLIADRHDESTPSKYLERILLAAQTTKLKKFDDLVAVLMEFNGQFPRPGIGPLFISSRYALDKTWNERYWPHSNLPGVYIVCAANDDLVYIGKASLNATLGTRLGTHFKKGAAGLPQGPEEWVKPSFVCTIPVPPSHAFEAPAIEEYLLDKLCTHNNTVGQQNHGGLRTDS